MHPALSRLLQDWLPLPANAVTHISGWQMRTYYSQDEGQLKSIVMGNLGQALGKFILDEGRGELTVNEVAEKDYREYRFEAYVLTKPEIHALMAAAFEAGRRAK
jgi:hypothetical protein